MTTSLNRFGNQTLAKPSWTTFIFPTAGSASVERVWISFTMYPRIKYCAEKNCALSNTKSRANVVVRIFFIRLQRFIIFYLKDTVCLLVYAPVSLFYYKPSHFSISFAIVYCQNMANAKTSKLILLSKILMLLISTYGKQTPNQTFPTVINSSSKLNGKMMNV